MGLYEPEAYSGQQETEPRRLRKGVFSKIVLGLVIVTVLLYTAAALMITCLGGVVPDSLTYSFYAFFGTELVSLVTIRVRKLKGENQNGNFGRAEGRDYGEEGLRGEEEDGAEAAPPLQEG